jgi:hypothetical protein
MRMRLRSCHCFALVVIAAMTTVFYRLAGFPLQVALGLALLSWLTVDWVVVDQRRHRP